MLKEERLLLHLDKIKRSLKITWIEDDEELLSIIEEGISFLEARAGKLDFITNFQAFKLLKEYCRYAWAGNSNFFESDYRHEILNLQIIKAIEEE